MSLIDDPTPTPNPNPDPAPNPDNVVKIPELPENWHQGLPEDLREDKSLAAYKTIPDLAKAMINARKLVGADKVAIPGKNATDEDWSAFFSKIGKPSDLTKYQESVRVPEGIEFREGFLESLQELAFNTNMLPSQTNKLIEWYIKQEQDYVQSQNEAFENGYKEEAEKLRHDWGSAYDSNMGKARKAFQFLAEKVQGAQEWFKGQGLEKEPMMLRLFAEIGKLQNEDGIIGRDTTDGGKTRDQVQEEINTILGDTEHAYHNKLHPNHEAEVKAMNNRFAQLHG